MGQAGMPGAIRRTVESVGARPQRAALWRARSRRIAGCIVFVGLTALPPCGVAWTAAAAPNVPSFEGYLSAFALLDRHEIAGLALTLGILCFAVVTAILLVRTRARLAQT